MIVFLSECLLCLSIWNASSESNYARDKRTVREQYVMLRTLSNVRLSSSVIFVSEFITFHLRRRNFGATIPGKNICDVELHAVMDELIYIEIGYKLAQLQTNK